MKRLLAVTGNGRYAARNRFALMLSYLAGMRVGEIASLTAADVFDANGIVKLQILLRAENTKGNEARYVYVNAKLAKEIEKYCTSFSVMPKPEKPLLQTQKNRAFSANTLCQLFGELYRKAGIDGATSHSGRRWFITKLAHNGISAKVIMTLAGHKHLSTTQRYIDVNEEMLKAAVEIL